MQFLAYRDNPVLCRWLEPSGSNKSLTVSIHKQSLLSFAATLQLIDIPLFPILYFPQ